MDKITFEKLIKSEYSSTTMEIVSIIVMIICVIGFVIALVNYSIISKSDVLNLNWKVKETFHALSALATIMIAKAIVLVQQLKYLEPIVNFVSILYVLIFNVVLLNTILKSAATITFCKDCINIPFYITVLWIVFEEKIDIPQFAVDVAIAILALVISIILLKLARYIRILNLIVVPVNMRPSLLAFLVFMMFYLTSVLAYSINENVSRCLLAFSLVTAIVSMILLDFELRKTVKF